MWYALWHVFVWACTLVSTTLGHLSSSSFAGDMRRDHIRGINTDSLPICDTLPSNLFEVQAVAMAHSFPTWYGQRPCCGSLLEIYRYGCCLVRDDVVESCTTRVGSPDSEDLPVVPTMVVSDSDDDALHAAAATAPNAAVLVHDAAPTQMHHGSYPSTGCNF